MVALRGRPGPGIAHKLNAHAIRELSLFDKFVGEVEGYQEDYWIEVESVRMGVCTCKQELLSSGSGRGFSMKEPKKMPMKPGIFGHTSQIMSLLVRPSHTVSIQALTLGLTT